MADEKETPIDPRIYAEKPGQAGTNSSVTVPLPAEENKESDKQALDKLTDKMEDDKKKEVTQNDTSGEAG